MRGVLVVLLLAAAASAAEPVPVPGAPAPSLESLLCRVDGLLAALDAAAPAPDPGPGACAADFSVERLPEYVARGGSPGLDLDRIEADADGYYQALAYATAAPQACRPLEALQRAVERVRPATRIGIDWEPHCRGTYAEMRFIRAVVVRSGVEQACLETLKSGSDSYGKGDPRRFARDCRAIAANLDSPEIACASAPQNDRAECLSMMRIAGGDGAACAAVEEGERDGCYGYAAFSRAFRAKDPEECRGNETCRALLGGGLEASRRYAGRLLADVAPVLLKEADEALAAAVPADSVQARAVQDRRRRLDLRRRPSDGPSPDSADAVLSSAAAVVAELETVASGGVDGTGCPAGVTAEAISRDLRGGAFKDLEGELQKAIGDTSRWERYHVCLAVARKDVGVCRAMASVEPEMTPEELERHARMLEVTTQDRCVGYATEFMLYRLLADRVPAFVDGCVAAPEHKRLASSPAALRRFCRALLAYDGDPAPLRAALPPGVDADRLPQIVSEVFGDEKQCPTLQYEKDRDFCREHVSFLRRHASGKASDCYGGLCRVLAGEPETACEGYVRGIRAEACRTVYAPVWAKEQSRRFEALADAVPKERAEAVAGLKSRWEAAQSRIASATKSGPAVDDGPTSPSPSPDPSR